MNAIEGLNIDLDRDPNEYFGEHLGELFDRTDKALEESGVDGVVICAGHEISKYDDDNGMKFVPVSEFARRISGIFNTDQAIPTPPFGRLDQTPGHVIVHPADADKPTIFINGRANKFFPNTEVPNGLDAHYDVVVADNEGAVWEGVSKMTEGERYVHYGPTGPKADEMIANSDGRYTYREDSKDFMDRFYDMRVEKTDYEIACMIEANRRAALGHRAAEEAFLNGLSAKGILNRYLAAIEQSESEAPYTPIIALNENGSILHWADKHDLPVNAWSMLIDAGATHNWYSSDITRTVVGETASATFADMVREMDKVQRELSEMLKPGDTYLDMQVHTHRRVAEILIDAGVLDCTVDEAIERGHTSNFYMHSWGHHIGIQTHDRGGIVYDENGRPVDAGHEHIKTAKRKPFRVGSVLTIEPGIYFDDSLLRVGSEEGYSPFNKELIAELSKHGGIRLETNRVIVPNGSVDITRPFVPTLTNA